MSEQLNAQLKNLGNQKVQTSDQVTDTTDALLDPYRNSTRYLPKGTNPQSEDVKFSKQQNVILQQIQSNEETINDLEANITDNSADGIIRDLSFDNAYMQGQLEEIRGVRGRLAETNTSQNSAADIASNDAEARAEKATTQTPELKLDSEENVPSNADEATQSNLGGDPQFDSPDDQGQVEEITIVGGFGSETPDDDQIETIEIVGGGATSEQEGINLPSTFVTAFRDTPNPLIDLGHYTYQVAIFMLTPNEYTTLAQAERKSVAGLDLLIQSGGISFEGGEATGGARRAPEFDLDYFIENLEIETLMPQEVRGATNATKITFQVTEPYGFSFINRLKRAAIRKLGNDSFLKQHYLMVIRFFGEDDNGNPVVPEASAADNNRSVNRSLIEKFIPFKFTKITTKAATGPVTYDCEALPVNHIEGLSQKRASIPFQVEIKGQTLNDLFNGTSDAQQTDVVLSDGRQPNGQIGSPLLSQPAGINTASKTAVSTGLVTAINNRMIELEKKDPGSVYDRYKVTFDKSSGMSASKIFPPGSVRKSRTPMTQIQKDASQYLSSKGQVQGDMFTISTNAGQQLQQFIDLIIRTSEYVTKQQTFTLDPNTGQPKSNNKANDVMAWYRIGVKVTPRGYCPVKNDYAYEIEYKIIPSQVTDVKSEFFPKPKFYGVHKRYDYWFTGFNTEVLSYEVEFNSLFYVGMSTDIKNTQDTRTEKGDDSPKAAEPPMEADTSGAGKSADPGARAASVLYSPVDFAMLRMEIFGDPDYIVQGDVFYSIDKIASRFYPDGTINFDAFEPLIEVNWNTIEDYDDKTGEAEVIEIEKKSAEQQNITATPGLIYVITGVTNVFKEGKFTQELRGLLREFKEGVHSQPPADTTRQAQPTPTPGTASNGVGGQPATGKNSPLIGPDYNFASGGGQQGNMIGGNRAVTEGTGTPRPNFNTGSAVPGERGNYSDGDPVGPDFQRAQRGIQTGQNVPGQQAIQGDLQQAPNFSFPNNPYNSQNVDLFNSFGDDNLEFDGTVVVDTVPPTGPVGGVRKAPPEDAGN